MFEVLNIDEIFMREALIEAKKAWQVGEVPVGAVIVKEGKIIARGYNRMIIDNDPSAHAEIQAIRKAAKTLNNYRTLNTTLYVTLEPCLMCSGAIVLSRISRVVYGARDPKTGADISAFNVLGSPLHNHRPEITGAVLEKECREMISSFFKMRRLQQKSKKV